MPCALTAAAVTLFNPGTIMAVLAELGIVAGAATKLLTSAGREEQVEATFADGAGRKAGLQKKGDSYRLVVDSEGLSAPQKKKQHATISQIIQRYVRKKAVDQLKKQGYEVAEEENQADGSIRVLVRKWSS